MNELLFVQYLSFKLDPIWRRLPRPERERGMDEFRSAMEGSASRVTTYSYSALGYKPGADLVLWRNANSPDVLQETLSELLVTGLGHYLEIRYSLLGMLRASAYSRRPDAPERVALKRERCRYLVVYPFTKTTDWYLTGKEARQEMMNEHMRIGHAHSQVHQMLVYSFGLDDQDFIVAYETDDLADYQKVVMELRETKARRFTLRDTPVFTCIYRPLIETLALLA